MNEKIEKMLADTKLKNLLEKDNKAKKITLWVFAVIGALAIIAGIAYSVYRAFAPDYLEDSIDIDD